MAPAPSVTQLLLDARSNDENAVHLLFSTIYEQLYGMAAVQLRRERRDHTLSPTALVHEAYIKMVDQTQVEWQDRQHFLAVSARAMRQILVDYARSRNRKKRRGNKPHIDLDAVFNLATERAEILLALDEGLKELEKINEQLARTVEYRFFGGYSIEETAKMMDVSSRTIERWWTRARLYLLDFIQEDESQDG